MVYTSTIHCPRCRGTGFEPSAITTWISPCYQCHGAGTIEWIPTGIDAAKVTLDIYRTQSSNARAERI